MKTKHNYYLASLFEWNSFFDITIVKDKKSLFEFEIKFVLEIQTKTRNSKLLSQIKSDFLKHSSFKFCEKEKGSVILRVSNEKELLNFFLAIEGLDIKYSSLIRLILGILKKKSENYSNDFNVFLECCEKVVEIRNKTNNPIPTSEPDPSLVRYLYSKRTLGLTFK